MKSEIKIGDTVLITKRKVSGKVQPEIKVGNLYYVSGNDSLKDGTAVLLIQEEKKSKKSHRCNANRFSWKKLTSTEIISIRMGKELEKQNLLNKAQEMLEKKQTEILTSEFSFDEQAQIAFIPLIIAHLAWMFAFKVIKSASEYRIDSTKKMVRVVRELHNRYRYHLGQSLDYNHLSEIESHAEDFYTRRNMDFIQMYHSICNSINKQYKDIEYTDIRAYAYISILMVRSCKEHEDRMTKLIRKKIRTASDAHLPFLDELITCMDAFLGGYRIEKSQNMQIAETIFRNNINKIHYVCKKK